MSKTIGWVFKSMNLLWKELWPFMYINYNSTTSSDGGSGIDTATKDSLEGR